MLPSIPRHRSRPRRRIIRPNMQKRKLLRDRRCRPHPRNPLRGSLPSRPRYSPPRPEAREPPLPNPRRQRRPAHRRLRSIKNNGRRSLPRPDNHMRHTRLHGARDIQENRTRETSVRISVPLLPLLPFPSKLPLNTILCNQAMSGPSA